MKIAMAGCGALGSRIAFEIAQPGLEFLLIDDDIIEPHNVETGTTIYSRQHIGVTKVTALGDILYRRACTPAWAEGRALTAARLAWFDGCDLVIVTFDNAASRRLCCSLPLPTLQVGVSEVGTGAAMWSQDYTPPAVTHPRGAEPNPVCTAHLGRHLIRFTAAVAAGLIEAFLATGDQRSVLTLVEGGVEQIIKT